ncbi:ABC transporter permease subunit [Aureimonas fodinaquatilis]|uniref:ABC transporter permease subunit n=1 Tax=Aureimonas fodinaquatilis TaxID=2565783 RepID=A0A5B0DUH6_9HYPH|nr:amino acid ABC transporter permease [Aureimonas fodinaquatilis]KAA0970116.1 ABC transporter permease subunit [Aureimonas fodinaquatilis]
MVDLNSAFVAREQKQPLPPPASEAGVLGWLRTNLFATPVDAIMSTILLAASFYVAWQLYMWGIANAVFEGTDRQACLPQEGREVGACWAFIKARFSQFIYGLYPVAERWRVDVVFAVFAALLVALAIPRVPYKRLNAILLFGVFPPIALVLLTGGRYSLGGTTLALFFIMAAAATLSLAVGRSPLVNSHGLMKLAKILLVLSILAFMANWVVSSGRITILTYRFTLVSAASFYLAFGAIIAAVLAVALTAERKRLALGLLTPVAVAVLLPFVLTANFGLPQVATSIWGGLLVTLVVAVVGIVASLPLGILLALGRQSQMPAVRLMSVIFIEFWRGVPLITVLFMANFMLPLFLPSGVSFNQLLRVLVGVSLFSAAYMAEVIRGGLQAIPKGQYEGADAMALTYWQKMRMIILPQALRLVIPGIVNTFIGLFKDTSLVYIIGLADLLGTVRRGFNDPVWITPSTPATGLVFAGFVFWLFCFAMSRYSIYMERRLSTGHKR